MEKPIATATATVQIELYEDYVNIGDPLISMDFIEKDDCVEITPDGKKELLPGACVNVMTFHDQIEGIQDFIRDTNEDKINITCKILNKLGIIVKPDDFDCVKEIRYFNFPIEILKGFLDNSEKVLINIRDYAIYSYSLDKTHFNTEELKRDCELFFNMKFDNFDKILSSGNKLKEQFQNSKTITGLNTKLYDEFFNKDKTEWEKLSLLGLLGLKSIIGSSSHKLITNDFWFSRMDGNPDKVDEFSERITKYKTRYFIDKLKAELTDNWNLNYYSMYTRGFYASYKLNIEELAFRVESSKKKIKSTKRKADVAKARMKAIKKLI